MNQRASRRGLRCEHLTRRFAGSDKGILDVTLEVEPGMIYALLGNNGAGKSTLINVCVGHLVPESGDVWIGSTSVAADPISAKRMLAYIPEVARLYIQLSGRQNIAFFSSLAQGSHDEGALFKFLGDLDFPLDMLNEPVRHYSKGMRQKILIAMGLLKGASVFLLDEPTSGLDARGRSSLVETFVSLRMAGEAVLFSSHDVSFVRQTADRVGVLRGGRLVAEGNIFSFSDRELQDLIVESNPPILSVDA